VDADRPPPLACPDCGRTHVARSRRRHLLERLLGRLLGLYPFRCQLCDRRFWRRQPPHNPEPAEERREYTRLPTQVLIGLRWAEGEEAGSLTDVSLAGGSVETGAPVPEGVLVRLTLQPSPDGPAVEVSKALVRSANPGRLGVEFVDVSPGERARLATLLQQLLAGGQGDSPPPPRPNR
jgi:hypothetical protein